jgi:hypothetical protein
MRDLADLTRYYHHWLTAGGRNTAGATFAPFHYGGTVTLKAAVPAAQRIDVARSMAYDASTFHEIYSYWFHNVPGMHSSGFSPEDCVSNYLGTYVAGRAMAAGGAFNTSVTTELNTLLSALGPLPPTGTRAVYGMVDGKWVKGLTPTDTLSDDYVRRRNFNVNPVAPWLVPGTPGCASTAWPTGVPKDFPASITGLYEIEFSVPIPLRLSVGRSSIKTTAFAAEIVRIDSDAATRYGASYKTPWP